MTTEAQTMPTEEHHVEIESVKAAADKSSEDCDQYDDQEHMVAVVTDEDYSGDMSSEQMTQMIKVVPLPHARSEVWSYFGFMADDEGEITDKKKAICKLCGTMLSYSGNTTNLFTHLKAMHPDANPQKLAPTNRTPRTGKKMGKRRLDAITGVISTSTITLDNGQPYVLRAITINNNHTADTTTSDECKPKIARLSSGGDDSDQQDQEPGVVTADDITNALVTMLVKDCRPVSLLEGRGFQDMLKLLAPDYKLPDTRTLESMTRRKADDYRRSMILRGLQDESR